MSELITFAQARRREHPRLGGSFPKGKTTHFDRQELAQILQVYSRKVMDGEWLDYAITTDDRSASFSVYGRVSAVPLFTITKRAKSAKANPGFQIVSRGRVSEKDQPLSAVLKELARGKPRLVKSA